MEINKICATLSRKLNVRLTLDIRSLNSYFIFVGVLLFFFIHNLNHFRQFTFFWKVKKNKSKFNGKTH